MSAYPPQISEEPKVVDVDPTEEYVAGGEAWWFATARELVDMAMGCVALSAEDIDAMMRDPQVSSSVNFLVESAMAEGIQANPGVKDKDPEFARASEINEAWGRSLDRAKVRRAVKKMLRAAVADGHKIAEDVWERTPDGLELRRLSVKRRGACRFVVDRVWNVVGIKARTVDGEVVLPVEKFSILSLNEQDEDPRGVSMLEPARVWWFLKTRIPPQYHRFLDQLILPIFLGYTSGNDRQLVQQTQSDGTKKGVTESASMRDALTKLRSMFVAVFPKDSKVDVVRNESSGEAFDVATNNVLDRQINKGIVLTDLTLREGQNQTRAATAKQMSATDLRILDLKHAVEDMLDELARKFVLYNYGEGALHLAPRHSLGDTERRDWAGDLKALGAAFTKNSPLLLLADIPKLFKIVGIELSDDWEERFERVFEAMVSAAPTEPAGNEEPGKKPDQGLVDGDEEDDEDEDKEVRAA